MITEPVCNLIMPEGHNTQVICCEWSHMKSWGLQIKYYHYLFVHYWSISGNYGSSLETTSIYTGLL